MMRRITVVLLAVVLCLSAVGHVGVALAQSPPTIAWLDQFGSSARDVTYGVAVDGAGNAYVVGYTEGSLPGQSSSGDRDAFVRKYDRWGSELWTRQFSSGVVDTVGGVAVDGAGNAYVVGWTGGTLPGQSPSGGTDAFVRKYDRWGSELWTRQFGSSAHENARGVAVDGAGNAYVAGITDGTLPGQTHSGGADAFIRKYDRWGSELWTRQFGTGARDTAWGVAVDGAGNAYVVASTDGTLPGQSSSGGMDAFVRKYDRWGSELWIRQFGSSARDSAGRVAVDGAGNAYVAGWTEGILPGQSSSGGYDGFVRKYDRSGNELWTSQFGTSASDLAYGVAVDGAGNAYVAGGTSGTLPGQTHSGSTDVFVRKYDRSGSELWTSQFGTSASDYARGVAADGAGNAYVVGNTSGTLPGQTSQGGYDVFIVKFARR